ncbi:MAG TPA: peptidase [Bacteroidia bacterium]|jgi:hypothetical protein
MRNLRILLVILLAGIFSCHKDFFFQVTPRDFLSGHKYNQLVIEVQYVGGYRPDDATLAQLEAFLGNYLNKPGDIVIKEKAITSPGQVAYSIDDIKKIEKKNRSEFTDRRTLTAYILFVDGDYNANSGNSRVLGMAYGSTSIVIFEKTLQEFSGGIGQPSTSALEETVSDHEFGHLLGLVNNGTEMLSDHQDAAHGKHCNVEGCLMNYEVETSNIVANAFNSVPVLDQHCVDDLRANGGK